MKLFKLLNYLLVVMALCIGSVSCNDDTYYEGDDLAGSWKVTRIEGWEMVNGQKTTVDRDLVEEEIDKIFTLRADGSGQSYDKNIYYDIQWQVVGKKFILADSNKETVEIEGSATVSGNSLVIEESTDEYSYKYTLIKTDNSAKLYEINDLVGTWTITHIGGWEMIEGEKSTIDQDLIEEEIEKYYTFKADGSGQWYEQPFFYTIKWELAGKKLVVTNPKNGRNLIEGTIEINGKSLIIEETTSDHYKKYTLVGKTEPEN